MKGGVEIIASWNSDHEFVVMFWGRHQDFDFGGHAFPSRQRAIHFAEGMVEASAPTLNRADVVPLMGGAHDV